MNLPHTLAANKSNGRDLHLLSIEGRGICGLTALITLKEILRQYQYLQKMPQIPRPSEVFDLAGGSGTGGLIAIMLFRLRMTIDEAITAYIILSKDVFSRKTVWPPKKSNASLLETAVAKVIQSSLGVDETQARGILMLGREGPNCFVIASTAKNMSTPTLFRTYLPPRDSSHNCTIVEAIRATTAEEPFFSSIEIGDANVEEKFIYGGSRLNNPVKAVLDEAASIFSGQSISCLLSIGSGAHGTIFIEATSTSGLVNVLKKVVNDGEPISDEVAKALSNRGVLYCRLNVDDGLRDIGFEDWERLGDVKTHTEKYLQKYDVMQKVDGLMQVLNRRTVIANTVEETLRVLTEYLDSLISILPGESWNLVIFRRVEVEPSKVATETLNMQCALLQDTLESCMQGKNFVELPHELKGNIQSLLAGLKKMFQDFGGKMTHDDPITFINVTIQKLLQSFWFQNHIAGNIMVHDILKYIQKDEVSKKTHAMNQSLGNLNVAPSAAYNSSEVAETVSCFKGTRVRLLNEIASWMTGDGAPIYVLDGVAGIGKSTIAKTVAEHAAEMNALGASFFFSRNDKDNNRKTAKNFFPAIAYQLAYYDRDIADYVNGVLLRTPHIVTQPPHEQFSTLILEPLKKFFTVTGNPVVIVIDALDECEHGGDALLKIFADSIKTIPRLKLFITTRPEHHIRIILDRCHHFKQFHLQSIEKSVVQSDIRLYLDFHLSENQVRDKLPYPEYAWKPTEKDLGMLIGICGTLFILASTAVKFILDSKRSNPAGQLSRLLRGVSHHDFSGSKYTTAMDSFYSYILLSAVPDDDDHDDWLASYQMVVGTIIALQYPLPCRALSALVDPHNVQCALSHLHSLIPPTGQDLTFQIHHQSFPDFVTSPSRCERRFLIGLTMRHLELGKRCLMIMDSHLKPNIYKLGSVDRFKDNRDIQHPSRNYISKELAYASTHWATHLANGSTLDGDAEQLLGHFARKHLLAWLEVLSIIGQVEAAYSSLDEIRKLLSESNRMSRITAEIFHDGCRFIALNIEIIKASAGHVFSALAFGPQDTRLYRTYRGSLGINFEVVSGYEKEWNPTISVMAEHGGIVNSVTFSEDGIKLASRSEDRTVRVWDGQTGSEIMVLQGHSGSVCSVSFSPDGTKLASASVDETVRLWDGQTGNKCAVLRGHQDVVNSVVFSPDGAKIASASDDKTVRLWDGQTGAQCAVLQDHEDAVNAVLFSSDGTRLASASDDGIMRLWDGDTYAKIAVLQWHSTAVTSLVFSLDGTKLASASDDKTVRLWDGQTGAKIAVLRGHSKCVHSVVFSTDGATMASASADGTVRLWDGETGVELAILPGHSNWVKSVVFSLDGTKLASSDDRTVRLWDVQTRTELTVLQGHEHWINSVVFSPDSTRLASSSHDRSVRLWDVQAIANIAVLPGHSDSVSSVVFSPDGKTLASASFDETVHLWDGQTGAEITILKGHSGSVNSVVFSPDGTTLASASEDTTVRLWNAKTGAEIGVLRGHSDWVRSVAFSSDGAKLASASNDSTVRLWDVQTITEIAVLRGWHSSGVNSVEFSPDGTKLAASDDTTVRLWVVETGAVTVLRGHSDWIRSMVFSPDGTKLATASRDRTVRLWDGQTGVEIASFPGTGMAAFTLDSSRLLSMNRNEFYQVNCITGVKLEVANIISGMSIYYAVKGASGPSSNLWVFLVCRKQPSLPGLLIVKVDDRGVLRFASLCWFPPNLGVVNLAVSSLSRVAVGCVDGRMLLLDVDFASLL